MDSSPEGTSTNSQASAGERENGAGSQNSVVLARMTPDDRSCRSSQSSVVVVKRSVSQGSSMSDLPPPPDTPRSNFNLQLSNSSSSDEGSGDSSGNEHSSGLTIDDPDDLFPAVVGVRSSLREVAARRFRAEAAASSSTDSSMLGSQTEDTGTIQGSEIRRRERLLQGRMEDDLRTKNVVLCVIWGSDQFAAAFYDLETGELYLLPDIADSPPSYDMLRTVISQVCPSHVIVNRSSDERFMKVIHEVTGHAILGREQQEDTGRGDAEIASTSSTARNRPLSEPSICLYQLPYKDFSPEACKNRIRALSLPSEPKDNDEKDHLMFISSVIPFHNEKMIRAAGCLLKFLDKSSIEMFQLELIGGYVPVSGVQLFNMEDVVLVDATAWRSLQIFATDLHPSSFKHGTSSSSKEGLSVYGLLSQSCVTHQGKKRLRRILLQPTRNTGVLKKRYDAVEFLMDTNRYELTKSLVDSLKSIGSIPRLLYRLSMLNATPSEWKDLYQTFYHCALIGQICASYEQLPELISAVGNPEFNAVMRTLTIEINRIIDLEESQKKGRVCANGGIDAELDRKRKQFSCMPEILSVVGGEEMSDLPPYVQRCCAIYFPEIGYLLGVTLWREDLSDHELQIDNFDFRFRTPDTAYYKTARMKELDVVLGDCSVAMLEIETGMMLRLAEMILDKSSTIQKVGDLVYDLDCLIAIAKVSKDSNYVRPVIVPADEKRLRIIDGRHPVSELVCSFVPNSTKFLGPQRMVVITGANCSGKSIYMKQVGVITIMALSGCFVPATYAQIPAFDKIFTRIHAVESISTGLSSFLIDLNQMALALNGATKSSLVIIDEFGKGTTEVDGLSLLAACMQDFVNRGDNCPIVFLCTHFQSLPDFLDNSPLLKYQTMKFMEDNENGITYLFQLDDGICSNSFAISVAKCQGFCENLLKRACEAATFTKPDFQEQIKIDIKPMRVLKEEEYIKIADEFLALNFDEMSEEEVFEFFKTLNGRCKSGIQLERDEDEDDREAQ